MATTNYLLNSKAQDGMSSSADWNSGAWYEDRTSAGTTWFQTLTTGTSRGASTVQGNVGSQNGPTSGLEFTDNNGLQSIWFTPPLSADVTISGSITFNVWASESSMSANATVACKVWVVGVAGTQGSTIVNSSFGTELTTSLAAKNWSATPTSTTVHKGERIAFQFYYDDATSTMASGYTLSATYAGASAAASGDSYVTLNENLSFSTALSAPAGTTFYVTDVNSDIDPNGASWDAKKLSLTRDDGYVTSTTSLAGATAPGVNTVYVNYPSNNNYLEWFTPQLSGFTLSGPVRVTIWDSSVSGGIYGALYAELAVTNDTGGGATVYAGAATKESLSENGTTPTERTFYIYGDDITVSQGNRLRLRFCWTADSSGASTSGANAYFQFGATGTSTGNTYIVLTESPSEYDPRKFIAVIT